MGKRKSGQKGKQKKRRLFEKDAADTEIRKSGSGLPLTFPCSDRKTASRWGGRRKKESCGKFRRYRGILGIREAVTSLGKFRPEASLQGLFTAEAG